MPHKWTFCGEYPSRKRPVITYRLPFQVNLAMTSLQLSKSRREWRKSRKWVSSWLEFTSIVDLDSMVRQPLNGRFWMQDSASRSVVNTVTKWQFWTLEEDSLQERSLKKQLRHSKSQKPILWITKSLQNQVVISAPTHFMFLPKWLVNVPRMANSATIWMSRFITHSTVWSWTMWVWRQKINFIPKLIQDLWRKVKSGKRKFQLCSVWHVMEWMWLQRTRLFQGRWKLEIGCVFQEWELTLMDRGRSSMEWKASKK